MGEMGKGEMGTAHAGKPPSLPRELRTPLVYIVNSHCIHTETLKHINGRLSKAVKWGPYPTKIPMLSN
jgi:hypothetical protein